jgi:hypothetical protein
MTVADGHRLEHGVSGAMGWGSTRSLLELTLSFLPPPLCHCSNALVASPADVEPFDSNSGVRRFSDDDVEEFD